MRQLALAVLVCSLVAGCQPAAGTVPVKGKVTLKGAAAPDGTLVTFSPIGEGGETASGRVQGGQYELFTGNRGDVGAKPGKYKVSLTGGSTMGESDYSNTASKKGQIPGSGSGEFPKEYSSAETTPLEKEVTSGSNTIDIEVP